MLSAEVAGGQTTDPRNRYINALADRVEGLERSQRQSFGAGGFAESFSPDDPTGTGFNRASSFSAPAHISPFAQSEYSRDRIPSIGWTANPPGPGLRSRAVGSLAIAPNETLPASRPEQDSRSQNQDLPKTLPTENSSFRPAKRPRMIQDTTGRVGPFKIDQGPLDKYYQQYHALFSLLPESARVIEIVGNAEFVTQDAFLVALDLLPDLKAQTTLNGVHDTAMSLDLDPAISQPRKTLQSSTFASYDQLQDYLQQETSASAASRSEDGNLTLVWVLLLLAIGTENNVKNLIDGGSMPKSRLLDYCGWIVEQVGSEKAEAVTFEVTGQQTTYPDEVNQAYSCICFMHKYHALALGIPGTREPYRKLVRIFDAKKLPPGASYIASSSNLLGSLSNLLHGSIMPRAAQISLKENLMVIFEQYHYQYEGYLQDFSVAKQIHRFMELSLSPYESDDPLFPDHVLKWVDQSTSTLLEDAKATAGAPRFNPVEMTTWFVTAYTLCEFVTDVGVRAMANFASQRLEELRVELQKKSDAFHKNYAFGWFFGEGKMEHWTDTVLAMIDYVKARPAAADHPAVATGHFLAPRFATLMEKGWMNGLLCYAKEDE